MGAGQDRISSIVVRPENQLATTSSPQHTTDVVHGLRKSNFQSNGYISAREAKRRWTEHVAYARIFGKVEEETNGFRIYRPILCGFPDAAILAMLRDTSMSFSAADIVLASLAADDPGNTLFGAACMPLGKGRLENRKRMTIGDVASSVNKYTMACYEQLGFQRWFHSHAFKEVEEDLRFLPGADDVWSGGRETMICELTAWENAHKNEERLPLQRISIPSIANHFDIIDVLIALSYDKGEVRALNAWRLLPSGSPLRVDDPVEYALRTTYLPSTGSKKCWAFPRFVGKVAGVEGLSLTNHFEISGGTDAESSFAIRLHCPESITEDMLKRVARDRQRFWNSSAKHQGIRRNLSLVHRVAVTMFTLSARWDGVLDLPPGEVTHRVCCKMPSAKALSRGRSALSDVRGLAEEHRRLLLRIRKAAAFVEADIENCELVMEDAATKIQGLDSGAYVSKLGLSMSIHDRAQRILKTNDVDLGLNGGEEKEEETLESVMVPRLQDVQRGLYCTIKKAVQELDIEKGETDIDEHYCRALMENDDGVDFHVCQRGFSAGDSANSVSLTLNLPKQVLIAYNMSEKFLQEDASVRQPVDCVYTILDSVKACLLASSIRVDDEGWCEMQSDALDLMLEEVKDGGLPVLRFMAVGKVEKMLRKSFDPVSMCVLWSKVRQCVEEYCEEREIKLCDWIYREILCVFYSAVGGSCKSEPPHSSFITLLRNYQPQARVGHAPRGTLVVDEDIPAGGMKHCVERKWIRTRKGDTFQYEMLQNNVYIVGDLVKDCGDDKNLWFGEELKAGCFLR